MTFKILIDFLALIALYVFFFLRKWKARGKDILLVNTTMYIYLSFVLFFTLMPIITALPFIFDHPYTVYLDPFSDYMNGRGDATRQIVLNVIMTVPFGFLFPLTQRKSQRTLLRTLLFTFLLSLIIELVQPLLHGSRSCDVTDLITNSLGGVIGYVFYLIFRPVTSSILRRVRGGTRKTHSSD